MFTQTFCLTIPTPAMLRTTAVLAENKKKNKSFYLVPRWNFFLCIQNILNWRKIYQTLWESYITIFNTHAILSSCSIIQGTWHILRASNESLLWVPFLGVHRSIPVGPKWRACFQKKSLVYSILLVLEPKQIKILKINK